MIDTSAKYCIYTWNEVYHGMIWEEFASMTTVTDELMY